MRSCINCGQPEAEALDTAHHVHVYDHEDERRKLVDGILHDAYPSALVKLRLLIRDGRIQDMTAMETPLGALRMPADELAAKLDTELERRFVKAAYGKGGGT